MSEPQILGNVFERRERTKFIFNTKFIFRGSAIAKLIGANAVKFNEKFEERVTMYVYEEMIDGKKLTEIINEQHENVKYLPGQKLPVNIVSNANLFEKLRKTRETKKIGEKKNKLRKIIGEKEKNICL